jgi:CRISPR-associated endonuclease Csn1
MQKERQSHHPYRLGLDLGSNSIGWSVIRLDEDFNPCYLERLGVRIFSSGRNPKDGTSLAVNRRLARQQRRRRDRLLRRKARLLAALRTYGLFPTDTDDSAALKNANPYELRARALVGALQPFELGRAIFHLNQRRGFKSNRRTDRGEENEKGKIASAIARLRKALSATASRTLGEHLYKRFQAGQGTRARRFGDGTKAEYAFYVDRAMVEHEFESIWAAQRVHASSLLTSEAYDAIKGILLFQRPLRPVSPGRCSLEPTEERAPLALPTVQWFRIVQEVNNLRVREHETASERQLNDDERDALLVALSRSAKLSFTKIRSAAKLPRSTHLNLESEKRSGLLGATVNNSLADPSAFGVA